jgi:hypothetical protein
VVALEPHPEEISDVNYTDALNTLMKGYRVWRRGTRRTRRHHRSHMGPASKDEARHQRRHVAYDEKWQSTLSRS